jgi:hypothetical protein
MISRRQRIWGAATAGVLAATILVVSLWGGSQSTWPTKGGSSAANTLLWLYAPRDMGRLPARASWCTGSAHCWVMQETAGATQLADTVGGWTLDATGTPRAGVYTGLPVEDATGWVDFSSELSTHTDGQSASGTGAWMASAKTSAATDLVSVSAVILPVYRQATARTLYSHRVDTSGIGYSVGLSTDGTLYMVVRGATATKTVKTAATWDDGAWHAVTFVLDGRSANAGRIYVDGVEAQAANPDLSGTGSWAVSSKVVGLGCNVAGANLWPGGIARLRVTAGVDVAATYAGSLWGFSPHADSKIASADIAWTQSGGVRCFRISATQAFCGAGGKPTHTVSAALLSAHPSSGIGWAVTPSRTNRQDGSQQVCTAGGWAVTGAPAVATCHAAIAPDGSRSAASIQDSNTQMIFNAAAGYGANATVYPRVWMRCSSGIWVMQNAATNTKGKWNINCATVAGVWAEITGTHPAVTVVYPWVSDATGSVGLAFVGGSGATVVSADVWLPTVTLIDGDSVIPTKASVVSTGQSSFTIDNAPAAYYSGSCGKLQIAGDWTSGGCLDIHNGLTNVGRHGFDGAHWHLWNSDATEIATANLVPSGVDTIQIRWNSASALAPLTTFAEVLRDGVASTWDATPNATWTPSSPTVINLDGYGATECRGVIQSVRVWDRP